MSRRLLRLIACLAVVSCSREPQSAAPARDTAPAAPAAKTVPAASNASSPAPPENIPAESSLAIKRGMVTLATGRTTYRPCDETADLWLLDQTDGVLRQAFQTLSDPATLYIEAYGERTQVPPSVATARGYAGALILEEVLYAVQRPQTDSSCDARAPTYVVAAGGAEPFWSAEIREQEILWRQAAAPREILMQIPATADAEGTVSYRGVAQGYELEMDIEGQPCRDAASGEYFAYSARASLNGREFNGCARVGS